jgi:hypothetical protein
VFRRLFRRKRDRKEGSNELVEVTRLGNLEAELIAAQLRDQGIDATVFTTGTAGENAALTFSEGSRVMVPRQDAPAAARILEDLDHRDGG